MVSKEGMDFDHHHFKDKQKKALGHVVDVPELGGTYSLLSQEVFTIKRARLFDQETHHIDIFGQGWVFFYALSKKGEISVVRDGARIFLGQQIMGYIPGKSVVEWVLPKGEIEFELLVSEIPLSRGAPDKAICVNYSDDTKNLFELFAQFFENFPELPQKQLSRCSNPTELSFRVQEWIHLNWRTNFKINDLAKHMNKDISVISRYFKRSFGLSPLKYVNQLRVITSVRDLLKSQRSISQISYDMGFGDPRLFNEHFRKIYPVKPFAFKRLKNID